MRHGIICFLFLCLLLWTACAKDNIVLVDPVVVNEEEDHMENTTFDRFVSITFSADGDAEVSGLSDSITASIHGNKVTLTNLSNECVQYELSGSSTDGFFKLYSDRKQAIILNGLNLTNPNGAAINVQNKRTYLVVNGDNSLADGTNYSNTPSDEDEKAALFSEDQLIISGEGNLTINATGKSGIAVDDYLRILGRPTLHINVSGNAYYDDVDQEYKGNAGVKLNGDFILDDGSLSITNSGTGGKGITSDGNGYFYGGTVTVNTTGNNYGNSGGWGNTSSSSVSAKGIKFDGNLLVAGGKILVNCHAHEGIEAKGTLTISGGEVYSYSAADDAINAGGDFTINGGMVYGYASNNDGLDANGDFYVNGGVVYAIGANSPEVALDANTEGGHQLYVNGGVLIAIGGLENGASFSQSCFQASSWSQNTWYELSIGSTNYAFKTPSNGGTPLVVSGASTPTLKAGVTVSDGDSCFEGLFYADASTSGGQSVSLTSYTGGNGGGGGPGGGGGGGNGPGGGPF